MTLQIDSATTAAAFTDTASRPRMPAIAKMEIISLDPTKLQKSPGNKREYDEKRSAKYGRNWDSFLAGTIHCAFRDGIYWCIDGWHRRNGAIFAGESTVRVLVIHGYSEADDARAFDFLNTERVKISAANEFWARVDYGHPTALAVMDVCTKADVRLPVPSPSGSIGTKQYRTDVCAAFAALQLVVDRDGPECLFETLKTIRAAWPDDPRALEAASILWLSSFRSLYRSHPDYSQHRLTERLKTIAFATLVQRIKALDGARGTSGKSDAGNARGRGPSPREVVLGVYNLGLRTHKLPSATNSDLKRSSLGQNPWTVGP
jgi:hypothetical protein